MAGTNATTVLVIVPIKDITAAVFDRPVTAIGFEDALGIGLIRGAASDPRIIFNYMTSLIIL
jgi:hypothetical protein